MELAALVVRMDNVDSRVGRIEGKVDDLDESVQALREDAAEAKGLRQATSDKLDALLAELRAGRQETREQHASFEGRLRAVEQRRSWGVTEWTKLGTLIGALFGGASTLVYALMGHPPPPPPPVQPAPTEDPAPEAP